MAVDGDGPLSHIIETRQQIDDRGFPGSGRADQRNRLAWIDMQIDRIQNVPTIGLVAEYDIVEIDTPLDLRKVDGARRVSDRRFDVKSLENAFKICGACDELVVEIADADHRIPEIVRVTDKGDKHAGGHIHRAEPGDAHIVDQRDGHYGNGLDARPHQRLDMHSPHPGRPHFVLLLLEGPELFGLPREGLRGLHTGDRLMDIRIEIALLIGQRLIGATLEMLQYQHPDNQQREQREAEQGKPPIDHEHHHHRDEEGEHVGNHIDQARAQRIRQGVHIVDHTDEDLAVRSRIEVAERQGLDMREQVATHVFEHKLADARDLHGTVAQAELVDDDQHAHRHDKQAQRPQILMRYHLVDHDFGQIRHRHGDAAHHHDDTQNTDDSG